MSEGERRGEESIEERMASRKSSMFSVASRRSSMATVEEDPASMTLEQDRERKGVASSCGREEGTRIFNMVLLRSNARCASVQSLVWAFGGGRVMCRMMDDGKGNIQSRGVYRT